MQLYQAYSILGCFFASWALEAEVDILFAEAISSTGILCLCIIRNCDFAFRNEVVRSKARIYREKTGWNCGLALSEFTVELLKLSF